LTNLGEIFQPWTCRDETLKKETRLQGLDWVEEPLKKIYFRFGKRGKGGTKGQGPGGDKRSGGLRGLREQGSGEGRERGYEGSRGLGWLRGQASGEGQRRGYEGLRGLRWLRGSPDRCSGRSKKEDKDIEAKGSGESEKEDRDVKAKGSGFCLEPPSDVACVPHRRHSYP
jgi:hypothetical protein